MGSLITFMLHCVLLFYNSDCENIFVGTVCVILRLIWKTRECIRLCIIVELWDECVKCVCVYSWPYSICNENLPVAVKISFFNLTARHSVISIVTKAWEHRSSSCSHTRHHFLFTPILPHPLRFCHFLSFDLSAISLLLECVQSLWLAHGQRAESVFVQCGWEWPWRLTRELQPVIIDAPSRSSIVMVSFLQSQQNKHTSF